VRPLGGTRVVGSAPLPPALVLFFAMLQRQRRLMRQISGWLFQETGDYVLVVGKAPAGAGGNLLCRCYPHEQFLSPDFLTGMGKRF
jgi:hypothetical protein